MFSASVQRRKAILLLCVWLGTALALLPAVVHWQPPAPRVGHSARLQIDAGYMAALGLCWVIYKVESRRIKRSQRLALVFLIFLPTAATNSVHRFYVDRGTLLGGMSNLEWQEDLQKAVMALSPAVAPHSYRPLPNSLVRWLEMGGIGYEAARDIYRLLFGLLLFYALYRFARLFTSFNGATLALLLIAAIYPVSFEYYAGQLTDPISHLSFVLAFIFLATGNFAFLGSTLVLGSLAKETVLAMAGFYVLFRRQDEHYRVKACVLVLASLAAYTGVRAFVLHANGAYRYEQVSGVSPAHTLANLSGGRWQAIVALTAGGLAPFLVLGWKQTPLVLKQLSLYLFPILFLSSLFFGWLFEGRNFMPLVFVLAVVTGNYLSRLSEES